MVLWILVSLVLIAGIGGVLSRRDRRPSKMNVADELFEGLLPSAATGHPDRPPESDGWGLRWADAVNLTTDSSTPATSRPQSARAVSSVATETHADAPPTAESTPRS